MSLGLPPLPSPSRTPVSLSPSPSSIKESKVSFTVNPEPLFLLQTRTSTISIRMVRKRFQDVTSGMLSWKSTDVDKFLTKIGLGKEDHHFWKQIGKGLLCTYALFGAAWLYNETSPLGWWNLKPRPKEEVETMQRHYQRKKLPYPGDEEAMKEFILKGGMFGTTIGPKGMLETDKDSVNYQKVLQDEKFDQEAMKLWTRMRNEVVTELQEKGFDVE